jgi:methenyltetrahydrofolate cyclohydrolase
VYRTGPVSRLSCLPTFYTAAMNTPAAAGTTFSQMLDQIAAKTPTPGGGAVACATGALAAALAGMVVSYSAGKKNLAAHQPQLEKAARALESMRAIFLELGEEDAQAYGIVNELTRLPESDSRRQQEMRGAMLASIQVPMAAIAACGDLLRLCEELAPITNKQLHSDLGIAVVLADAAARSSFWNVRVNAGMLADEPERRRWMEQAQGLIAGCSRRATELERTIAG